jgi:Sulfotransferase family
MAVARDSRSAHPARRVPDFFIVGAPKSGTTALHQMLQRHPQIFMPDVKEPLFLASDARARPGFSDAPRELRFPLTLEAYLALFDDARPGQRAGEASTVYLWSRTAAAEIAQLQPQARIIAILREPVSFLRSLHHTYLLNSYETEKGLLKAMSLESARREGNRIPRHAARPQLLQYSEHVRYVEQLRRYHDRFPPEHVLVLIYDDLCADTQATVRQVLRFLEVDDEYPIKAVKVNVTRHGVRSTLLKNLLESTLRERALKARSDTILRLQRGLIRTVRRRIVLGDPPQSDDSYVPELRRRFKGEVEALSEYLGRDLVRLWGYEEVR